LLYLSQPILIMTFPTTCYKNVLLYLSQPIVIMTFPTCYKNVQEIEPNCEPNQNAEETYILIARFCRL
jgi:hypothetical protein